MIPLVLIFGGIIAAVAGRVWSDRQKHMRDLVEPLLLMASGALAFVVGVLWLIVNTAVSL